MSPSVISAPATIYALCTRRLSQSPDPNNPNGPFVWFVEPMTNLVAKVESWL